MTPDPTSLLLSGIQHQKLGRLQEAEHLYLQALDLHPGLPEAHCNLGILLHGSGRLDQAAQHLQQATLLKPGLSQAWNNLGVVLRKLHRFPEAREALTQALRLAPHSAATHHNLTILLRAQKEFPGALRHAQAAAKAAPSDAGIASGVGEILLDLDRPEEATAYLRKLSRRFPKETGVLLLLGAACLAANALGEAAEAFGKVIQIEPGHVEANYSLGFVQLLQGDLEKGLLNYEWRLRRPRTEGIAQRQPGLPWRGENLEGRTLLVYLEQGRGDAIHFARFLPGIHCGRLIVRAPETLHRLLATLPCPLEIVGSEDYLAGVDFNASIMSLALRQGTSLGSIPREVHYLSPDPAGTKQIADRLGPSTRPRVGLCWQGNPDHPNDRRRSIPPRALEGLVRERAADWVNLQVPPTPEDPEFLPLPPVELDDFMDTMCLLASLDLVVTVDTATAHAAGVLGKPTFLLLPFAPDWRWMLDRSDSPWYPSFRLFRQHRPGDWSGALADLSAALDEFLANAQA
jgi:Flp pilus assembly protein TadD